MRAILTYHSLDHSGSPISLDPAAFRGQLEWFRERPVRVVHIAELLTLPAEVDAVALTFDDGFANFATEAAPPLRERGFPVTLFIVTGHVGRDNRWHGRGDAGVPVLPLLDWDALGRLQESGVKLAAHTQTHPHLTTRDSAALEAELALAPEEMQRHLGTSPEGLAYPYGDTDERVVQQAKRTYRWACTTEFRALGRAEAPLRLPRLDAWYFRDPRRLAHWGSPTFRAWVWSRRQARRVRARLRPRPAA